jgi:hypothetical protein
VSRNHTLLPNQAAKLHLPRPQTDLRLKYGNEPTSSTNSVEERRDTNSTTGCKPKPN